MRIGKKVKITEEPRPTRAPVFPFPMPSPGISPGIPMDPFRMPEKVPIPARRSQLLERGYTVEEIPYRCPFGGEELVLEDDVLYCPKHGVIYG